MGKQKGQRTKNNARPSSSGRSFELLANARGQVVGFSALKDSSVFVGNAESDGSLKQNFQLIFKKMNKKDPTTKHKALQEFIEECKRTEPSALKPVLPYWSRIYNILASEVDYQLRDLAQQAHKSIVTSIKRDIAPYLKQFIATWFVSRFDSNPVASSTAKASFEEVFPPCKRTEVLIFCQKEILSHIVQNVIHETKETVANNNTWLSADEAQAKYQRLVTCCLYGYEFYVRKLPKDVLLNAQDEHKKQLVNCSKFWKYPRRVQEASAVKVAWYSVIATLIKEAPFLLEDQHKNLISAIIFNLDSADYLLPPILWPVLICSSTIVPDWWTRVSEECPGRYKILKMITHGAYDHPSVVYPALLPLLPKITINDPSACQEFYLEFFDAFVEGLYCVKVSKGMNYFDGAINSFFECLRYVIIHIPDIGLKIVEKYLDVVISKFLCDPATFSSSNLTGFSCLSHLLHYFKMQAHNSTEKRSEYEKLCETIWSSLQKILTDSVKDFNGKKDDLEKRLKCHQKLASLLKSPGDPRPKKHQLKVKFEPQKDLKEEATLVKSEKYIVDLKEELNVLVKHLISVYYDSAHKSKFSYLFINNLCGILNLFNEKCYFQHLMSLVSEKFECDGKKIYSLAGCTFQQFIHHILKEWLKDNRVSVDAVLNVVFHMLIYLKEEEKLNVLSNISKEHMSSVLELCLNLANSSKLQESARKWLNSSYFKNTLHNFTLDLMKEDAPVVYDKLNIMKTCFGKAQDGQSYTGDEIKIDILKLINESFPTPRSETKKKHRDKEKAATLRMENIPYVEYLMEEVFKDRSFVRKHSEIIGGIVVNLFLQACNVKLNRHSDTDHSDKCHSDTDHSDHATVVNEKKDEDIQRVQQADSKAADAEGVACSEADDKLDKVEEEEEDVEVEDEYEVEEEEDYDDNSYNGDGNSDEESGSLYDDKYIPSTDLSWVTGLEVLATVLGPLNPAFNKITEKFANALAELLMCRDYDMNDLWEISKSVFIYVDTLTPKIFGKLFQKPTGTLKQVDLSCTEKGKDEITDKREDNVEQNSTNVVKQIPLSEREMILHCKITSLTCGTILKRLLELCKVIESSIISACLKAVYVSGELKYSNFMHHLVKESANEGSSDEKNPEELKLNVTECFNSITKWYGLIFTMICIINHYAFEKDINRNMFRYEEEQDLDGNDLSNIQSYKKVGLGRLHEYINYVIYGHTVLKSFKKYFVHTKHFDIVLDEQIHVLEVALRDLLSTCKRMEELALKLSIMHKAFVTGELWSKVLVNNVEFLLPNDDMNKRYAEIKKFNAVQSSHLEKNFMVHITEQFAPRMSFEPELFSIPDAKLDLEKLSAFTQFLRNRPAEKLSAEEERSVWYWLDTLMIQRKKLESTFNRELTECWPYDIIVASTVCRFLAVIPTLKIDLLTERRLDFTLLSLVSWIQSINKTCETLAYEKDTIYNMPICIFISSVCEMMKAMTTTSVKDATEHADNKLFTDWNNVFSTEACSVLINAWKHLAESKNHLQVEQFCVLKTVSEVIIHLSNVVQLTTKFAVVSMMNFWINAATGLMNHSVAPVRIAAFCILEQLSTEMVCQDSSLADEYSGSLSIQLLPLKNFEARLKGIAANCDLETLTSYSPTYANVHSYLLLWYVIYKMCDKASIQLSFRYATWLKEKGFLENFLTNLYLMFPKKLFAQHHSDWAIKKIEKQFCTPPLICDVSRQFDGKHLAHMVCHFYYLMLSKLPLFTRQWWKSLDHKRASFVDKITTKFVSPLLICNQLKAIKASEDENFVIRGYPSTRQIVATYVIEQTNMEITLDLPGNHPLGVTKVNGNNVLQLNGHWRTWMKQLNLYISHQNGTIQEGLRSWKTNIDKAFQGVEECYICFSIVHSSNYELPKKTCRTCHKKFHGMCLYRWLVTSAKNTCPICRNIF